MRPSAMMQLLHDKVPLTLLLDLSNPDGAPSAAVLRAEPADLTWLTTSGPESTVTARPPGS